MEDFKWILYIIAAIYFVLKARKKKTPPADQDYSPTNTPDSSKPVSFEDLLREIQQGKAPAPKLEIKPAPKQEPFKFPEYVDYDDNIEEEAKNLEKVDYSYRDQDKIYDTYERAKQEAFNRPSLEEPSQMKETVVKFSHFKEYDQLESPSQGSIIGKEFRSTENLKKAFIMSEILNRKY